jgi:ATP-binding cassette, subfamily B, bacterial
MAMSSDLVLPAKGDLHYLARLGRFLAPYRWRIGAALGALVVAASCVLVLGQGLRHVVDAGFGSGDPNLLNAALAAVVAVSVVLACATWARFYLMMSVGEFSPMC